MLAIVRSLLVTTRGLKSGEIRVIILKPNKVFGEDYQDDSW
jgi:hypothetical protein